MKFCFYILSKDLNMVASQFSEGSVFEMELLRMQNSKVDLPMAKKVLIRLRTTTP